MINFSLLCTDPGKFQWDFALSEHDALVDALKPLSSEVKISPLPKYVKRVSKCSNVSFDIIDTGRMNSAVLFD